MDGYFPGESSLAPIRGHVLYNSPVERIKYTGMRGVEIYMQKTPTSNVGAATDGEQPVVADAVIVTVPLGVLRAGIGLHGPAVKAASKQR